MKKLYLFKVFRMLCRSICNVHNDLENLATNNVQQIMLTEC